MDLHQLDRDVAELEAFEQGREPHLDGDAAAKDDSLLRHDNRVVDLVGPDVLDAHGMEKLERRCLEGPDDPQLLVGMDVVGQLAPRYRGLELVPDARLPQALDALGSVAMEEQLERPLVVPGGQRDALGLLARAAGGVRCADPCEWRPPVVEDLQRLVDLVCGYARRCHLCIRPAGNQS